MKKTLLLMTLLLALLSCARAEAFDVEELYFTPDIYVFEDEVTLDTVFRATNQPFIGEMAEGELIAYLDYVQLAEDGQVLLRLTVSTALDSRFSAEEMTITAGGKAYMFSVNPFLTEYDRTYYADYTVCFTLKSLPLLKAIAQSKTDDPLTIVLTDMEGTALSGRVVLPGQTAADMYDRFIDLGGKKQELAAYEDLWPVSVTKAH